MTDSTVTLRLVADNGQLVGTLRTTDRELGKLGTSAQRTGQTAGRSFRDIARQSEGMNRAVSTATRTVAGLAAAFLSLRSAAQAARAFIDFEDQLARVRAVTRANEQQMLSMERAARELGATTQFSASQAADGMQFLGRAGFQTTQIIQAMPNVLNLAAAASLDLGAAADIASNIMSAFGIAASESAQVADVLAAVAASANTDVLQMGEAMKFVGPVAASMGVEMSDAAAAVGALSNAGIQGGTAGTGLRRVLSSLANPTKQATEALRAMGVSVDEVNPATTDLVQIVERLRAGGLSAADALTIFGDRGGPAILALTEQLPQLRELTGSLREAGGTAAEMAGVMQNTTAGAARELRSALESVALSVGDAGFNAIIRTAITEMTTSVRDGERGIQDFAANVAIAMANVADVANTAFSTIGAGFSALGQTVGAGGAQLVLILQGKFSEARQVGELWREDMAGIFDRFADTDTRAFRDAVDTALARMRELRREVESGGGDAPSPQLADMAELLEELAGGAGVADGAMKKLQSTAASIRDELFPAATALAELEPGIAALLATGGDGSEIDRFLASFAEGVVGVDAITQATREYEQQIQLLEAALDGVEVGGETFRITEQQFEQLAARARETWQAVMDGEKAAKDTADAVNEELQRIFARELRDVERLTLSLGIELDQDALRDIVEQFRELDTIEDAFRGIGGAGEEAIGRITEASKQFLIAAEADAGAAFSAYTRGTAAALQGVQAFARSGSKEFEQLGVIIEALQVASAIQAVANTAATAPFPANFAAAASMLASLVSLGINIGGAFGSSGGGGSAGPANSGTVFGDQLALSESIANAVEISAEADQAILGVNRQMLQSLRSLEQGLAAAANLFARTELGLGPGPSGPSRLQNQLTGVALTGPAGVGAFAADRLSGIAANAVSTILPGALGDILGGIIDGIGGVLGSILGGIGGFFAGRPKIKDEGVRILGGVFSDLLDDITVEAFRDIKIRRRFRSNGRRFETEELTGEIDSQFQLIVDAIGDSVISAAQALRIDESAIDAALAALEIDEIRISTRNRSGEEIAEAVDAAFSNLFDQVAAAVVPFIDEFARIGEGAGETLTRIASNVGVAEAGLERLGTGITAAVVQTFETFSRLGETLPEQFGGAAFQALAAGISEEAARVRAQISTALIDAAGGLQEFGDLTGQFLSDFRTEAEQIETLRAELGSVFDDLGVALPDTRQGFVDLVEGFDVSDEASARLLVQLLELAPALDQVFDAAEAVREDALEVQRAFGLAASEFDDTLRELSITTLPNTESGMRELIASLSEADQAALRPFIGDLQSFVTVADSAAESTRDLAREAAERANLEIRLARALGDESRALALQREQELLGTAEANRGLLQQIFAAENAATAQRDLAARQQEAAKAAAELARQAQQLADSAETASRSLARQIAELRGQSVAAVQIGNVLSDISGAGSPQDLIDQFGGLQQALTAQFEERLQQINAEAALVDRRNQGQIDALNDQIRAVNEQISAAQRLRDIAADIRGFVTGLGFSDLGGGTPQQQLDAAVQEFFRLRNAAASGDLQAAQSITGVAQQALQLNQAVNASGPAAAALRETITSALDSLAGQIDVTAPEIQALENQLAVMEQQRDVLQQIRDNQPAQTAGINSVASAEAQALRQQFADQLSQVQSVIGLVEQASTLSGQAQVDALQTAREALVSIINGNGDDAVASIAGLRDRVSADVVDNTGAVAAGAQSIDQRILESLGPGDGLGGSILSINRNSRDQLQTIRQILNEQNRQNGFQTFARGGIATRPSIFGEAGPEAAVPLPDGRTIPVTISGGISNDAVVRELRQSNAELREQNRQLGAAVTVLQEGFQRQLRQGEKQIRNGDEMARRARLESAA